MVIAAENTRIVITISKEMESRLRVKTFMYHCSISQLANALLRDFQAMSEDEQITYLMREFYPKHEEKT